VRLTGGEDPNDSILVRKAAIRAHALAARGRLRSEARQKLDAAIQAHLRRLLSFDASTAIAGYRAHGTEVNIDDLLAQAVERGVHIYLPRTLPDRRLEFCRIVSMDSSCAPGRYGILEPVHPLGPRESGRVPGQDPGREAIDEIRPTNREQEPAVDVSLDVLLIPGVAFDRAGGRLGFGMGYYDRTLASLIGRPTRIGIAYECQIAPEIPMDAWDQRMDWVVTEAGIWREGRDPAQAACKTDPV
jgi:5-formyltetrahydrofolate cyclo-ligase